MANGILSRGTVDVNNTLDSTSTKKALSAYQGKVLDEKVDTKVATTTYNEKMTSLDKAISSANSNISTLTSDLKTANDNISANKTSIETASTEIDELQDINKITTGTLAADETSITITDSRISDSSILSFYTSVYGVSPSAVTVDTGSVTLTFDAQDADMVVGVKVDGTYVS